MAYDVEADRPVSAIIARAMILSEHLAADERGPVLGQKAADLRGAIASYLEAGYPDPREENGGQHG